MTSRPLGFSVQGVRWLALLSMILLALSADHHADGDESVDFSRQIRPILQSRCQPCHFAGGKVYAKLPFDQSGTIVTLGEKLFTRIKDENSRTIIRKFLAEQKKR